jgi:hypothetical protein
VASVCNFDRLSNTRDLMVALKSGTPRDKIFRVLDDTICVTAEDSGITRLFSEEMVRLCSFIDLPLAKNCENNDKAFENQKEGTVLGIRFNSTRMEWALPEEKARKVVRRCLDACNASHMDLKQTQKLMGTVNDVAQMCPMMKVHKGTGNLYLAAFKGRENILLPVPEDMKLDLNIIAKMAERAVKGLPIASEPCKAPLSAMVFYTDAAGASFTMMNGKENTILRKTEVSHVLEERHWKICGSGRRLCGQNLC